MFQRDISIGDTIRAYDFEPLPDRRPRYVEGIVSGYDTMPSQPSATAIVILCTADTTNGFTERSRIGKEVFVAEHTTMDYEGRIQVIG